MSPIGSCPTVCSQMAPLKYSHITLSHDMPRLISLNEETAKVFQELCNECLKGESS